MPGPARAQIWAAAPCQPPARQRRLPHVFDLHRQQAGLREGLDLGAYQRPGPASCGRWGLSDDDQRPAGTDLVGAAPGGTVGDAQMNQCAWSRLQSVCAREPHRTATRPTPTGHRSRLAISAQMHAAARRCRVCPRRLPGHLSVPRSGIPIPWRQGGRDLPHRGMGERPSRARFWSGIVTGRSREIRSKDTRTRWRGRRRRSRTRRTRQAGDDRRRSRLGAGKNRPTRCRAQRIGHPSRVFRVFQSGRSPPHRRQACRGHPVRRSASQDRPVRC